MKIWNKVRHTPPRKLLKYFLPREIDQLLYRKDHTDNVSPATKFKEDEGYSIHFHTGERKTGIQSIDRRLTKNRYVYLMKHHGHVIHESWIHCDVMLPHQFGFDPEIPVIGDCLTSPDYRGKGIYPFILQYIISNIQDDISKQGAYILVSPENTASIHGIEKAGFLFQGRLQGKRWLHLILSRKVSK